MTLFEIADVLWQRGEKEACNALFEHAREYTTLVECGLTLLAKDIARTAQQSDPEAALQLDADRRAEARMRASERDSPNSCGFDALVESIYEQLCEEGWRAA